MKWTLNDRDNLIKAMENPFNNTPRMSARAISARKRELGVESLFSRIKHQILECYDSGLDWRTPEDWDICFKVFGGKSSRRKSERILSRVTWEDFLKRADEIIKENREEVG